MTPKTYIKQGDRDFAKAFEALVQAERGEAEDVSTTVADIIAEVRRDGDQALCRFTAKFDRLQLEPSALRLSENEIDAAAQQLSAPLRAAIDLAAQRIRAYHSKQLPQDVAWTDETGARLGWRWSPVDAAGLYVPGGTAAYPSSVLMNAIPAEVAGVGRRAMVVPSPDGVLSPAVLYAAKTAGITEIWRIGGAQAIAALAYGTERIKPVNVITGPGNAYVAEAKRQVFGKVGIDSIAGPSEVAIIADESARADWIAADLMAQAEHDINAQSILLTPSSDVAEAVIKAVQELLTTLPRGEIARTSWERYGAVIVTHGLREAAELSNQLAPEHLELAVANPDTLMDLIKHAGAIFMGHHTPEAAGDYLAGPNHVLPTNRSAAHASGLSVLDFMKRTTLTSLNAETLSQLGDAIVTLAEAEGLDAHARSVALRMDRLQSRRTE